MSSLSNTTWIFNVDNGSKATWTFNSNGFSYANGIKLGTWVEDGKGNFINELNFYPSFGSYYTVWTGNHANGAGTGIVSPMYNGTLFTFKMSKVTSTETLDTTHEAAFALS
ncbi:hypothetical protein FE840_009970 [Peteryoungia desertarenae]|uniref:Uncharacterized protein n=1 Tax=Peteryoungia desertarenae TaxID=1813451 RepID=A0ABX6QNH2_9HYPH|nr:hypothetical protein [Peteryoungia desertarenae]QLF69841.1 hypothetical protein FE840_009970 [Peteryoungia desertarenae]